MPSTKKNIIWGPVVLWTVMLFFLLDVDFSTWYFLLDAYVSTWYFLLDAYFSTGCSGGGGGVFLSISSRGSCWLHGKWKNIKGKVRRNECKWKESNKKTTGKRHEMQMNMKNNVRKWKWKDNETETEGNERKMPDNEKRMKEKEKKMQRNQRKSKGNETEMQGNEK